MSTTARYSPVHIRSAIPEDAAICGSICFEAFASISNKHAFGLELPSAEVGIGLLGMLFSHPSFYCVVAESDGRIVGSNCLDERSTIAGIGPITVAPDVQNRSIGRILMEAVMERARERAFPGVRLVQATYHNRSMSLYTKLGFQVRELMAVMNGAPLKRTLPSCKVRRATEADLPAADRVCERVHGHTRSGELREKIADGTASVVERHGRITGYASGFGYFTHAVAECNLDLQALIADADQFQGPGMIVPTRNTELFGWCLDNGLRIAHPLTLMTMGLYNEPLGAYLPSILY